MIRGIIFDIKRFAVHDGPGVRTTVFMKGCPLSCWWCHNPEGISLRREIMRFEYKCIKCYRCVEVCPEGIIGFDESGNQWIDGEKCTACGACADSCPTGALRLVGREISVDELVSEVERDAGVYGDSGGGVTFSGGEPLYQPMFLREALKKLKGRYIHTALDTSGYASQEVVEAVMPYVDIFLYDIKLYDAGEHRRFTGVSNEIIKKNLKFLLRSGKKVILRFPVIPGITDTDRNVAGWVGFLSKLSGLEEIDLLPYHNVDEKFRRIGTSSRMHGARPPSGETMRWISEEFEKIGLKVKVGG